MNGQNLIAALCPELRALLDTELASGNRVLEAFVGWWSPDSVVVILAWPFRHNHAPLPAGIEFAKLNSPHYWQAEYRHDASGHILGCRCLP